MLSFFGKGDQKKQPGSGGPVVRRVITKKPISPKPTTNINTSTPSRPLISSSYKNGSSSTQSKLKPYTSSSSSKDKEKASLPPPRPASSPVKRPVKRKVESTRIESESESESSGEDATALFGSAKKVERIGLSSTPRPLAGDEYVGKDRVLFRYRDESGAGEWEGFTPGEEIVKGVRKGWENKGDDEGRVKSLLDKYAAYFPQEGFEKQNPLPFVELQYPAKGCRERFYLLNPTAPREYAPLRELRTTIQQILEFYIPPSHRHIFGTLSDSLDLDSPTISRFQSPAPAFPTPPSSGDSPAPPMVTETIGDAIRKALAPNRRDGPGFIKAMERFNAAMQDIQNDGTLANWLETRGREMRGREWGKLVDVVHDQAYARLVGPYSHELEHHPKHPDEVADAITAKEDAYGELRHDFMTKVIEQTGLGPNSVFVDLGSGVGNCVTQVALQAGARSYGYELLPVPAHCARLQLEETKKRWAMWCLNGNTDIEAHEGDFRTAKDVAKRLQEADVVLVNNEVFPSSLNIELTYMFLDMKDGAKIVSLKPFEPEVVRMNESNCDSFAAIVKLETHHYAKGWVSWKGDSGRYFIQTIDRSARNRYEMKTKRQK